jgi:two-component system CheB/CheR fusion protein
MSSNERGTVAGPRLLPAGERRLSIVGVGASAGGIEALEGFFREVSPNIGAAIVVILHLDPTHPSMAVEILGRAAQVPVREAENGVVLEPGTAYVIPPNASLVVRGRQLEVRGPTSPRYSSIDSFFCSLAEEQGEAAIGVVLSGAGSDGAAGLRSIKEHGGVTIAQDPEEARNDSMPRSAIALGSVDWILPVAEMPAKIASYGRILESIPPVESELAAPSEDAALELRAVLGLVLRKTGHDFAQYKQATMLRRVQRRMRLVQASSLAAYADVLRRVPGETERLFADLLIGVTQFFRDPEIFEALAAGVIPGILHERGADAEVRLWVPGCATGEEAYSFAILLFEALEPPAMMPPVKLFATDIDEAALDFARQGRYSPSIAERVSPERLARFFRKVAGGYQVLKEVRDLCVFSTHNIVSDPPFSRLDLISCRNLLIYLETEIQKKLVPLFHYALAPGGHLVLGPSENLAANPELFRVVDKESRIFQRLDVTLAPTMVFPLAGPRRIGRLERADRLVNAPRAVGSEQTVTRSFERALLDDFTPPAVMVNGEGRILYVSGRTGRFLQLPSGMTRTDLVDMALPALRPSVHTALHRAIKSGKPASQDGVTVEIDGAFVHLDVIVRPIAETAGEPGLYMVVFRELGAAVPIVAGAPGAPGGAASRGALAVVDPSSELAADLERELRRTREHLQTSIEELEAGSEELQSANEELLSTNEELQSANEELQTSKEEQQSINEELQTVNVELTRKVEELDRANGDLKNLFASTHIATLFLDGELHIKKFSPMATELFRVIESDVGRPVTDIAATSRDDLVSEVSEVLSTLIPREREVYRAEGDRWFIRRIRPYRSTENVIDGAVITLVDITELKRAQQRIAALAAIVESSQDAIVGLDLDGAVTSWNAGAERIYGYGPREATGLGFAALCPPEARPTLNEACERAGRGAYQEIPELGGVRRDGSAVDIFLTLSPVRDGGGAVVALAAIAHDVTEHRRAVDQLRQNEERLRLAVESTQLGTWELDVASGVIECSPRARILWGFSPDEQVNYETRLQHIHPGDRRAVDEATRRGLDPGGGEYRISYRSLHPDGSVRWIDAWGRASFVDRGGLRHPVRLIGALLDVTEHRLGEDALKEVDRRKDRFLAVLGHELRNPLAPIRNAVQVMRGVGAPDPALVRARDIIERQVRHMTHLLDDLLDVGRLASGKILLRKERMDLGALVRTAVDEQRTEAEASGLTLTLALPEDPVWTLADPTRLEQSVANLLINAVKFTPSGGHVAVAVRVDLAAASATITVTDDGVGLEHEMIEHLFEPFSQADRSLDRSRGGLGLGLSLVKSLVELHGGTVGVRSDGPGQGAAFEIHLPLEDAPAPALPAPAAGARSRRIVLVEDNLDSAESMAMMLELAGHAVAVAHTGAAGVEQVRSFRPDVVLCDIGLPGALDGYAVARALRADAALAGTRLIALTGYGQEDDKLRAREAGFEEHLTKPVDPDTLERVLAEE